MCGRINWGIDELDTFSHQSGVLFLWILLFLANRIKVCYFSHLISVVNQAFSSTEHLLWVYFNFFNPCKTFVHEISSGSVFPEMDITNSNTINIYMITSLTLITIYRVFPASRSTRWPPPAYCVSLLPFDIKSDGQSRLMTACKWC